jgi:hypothetical protein
MGARALACGLGFSLLGAISALSRSAVACGGCFNVVTPDAQPSFVTGHRMAFAVSATQTVLWDQFEYDGAPEDFSWVLPVRSGARLELADPAWLDALDSFTTPIVVPPQVICRGAVSPDGGGSGCGCASADVQSAGSSDDGVVVDDEPPKVEVVRQETIGPYETVVLSSEDPEALSAWLIEHGYVIPDSIAPVIRAYVEEGNDFLALRLSPGVGVNQMEPVRVITPGGDYLLPLRMVAAGVGASVAIKLFVIAETRYTMPDLFEVHFPTWGLAYDFATDEHNFEELRAEALSQNQGKSYLVTYAARRPFTTPNTLSFGSGPQTYPILNATGAPGQPAVASTLADLYFGLAAPDERAECAPIRAKLDVSTLVAPCLYDEPCPKPPEPALASQQFVCGDSTDLARALEGMHPASVWLTRMEMNLPFSALDADCAVEPASEAKPQGVAYSVEKVENAPCQDPSITKATLSFGFALWCATGLLVRRRSTRRRTN